MMKNKKIFTFAMLGIFGLMLAGCGNQNQNLTEATDAFSGLQFNAENYQIKTVSLSGEEMQVRAYENIVYVLNPVDEQYQTMNIYVPEAYFSGEQINGFNLETAAIFFPNKVGGYMPAQPETLGTTSQSTTTGTSLTGASSGSAVPQIARSNRSSASTVALFDGYIVASAGARGRTLQDDSGNYTGKAPAGIVDLKAAIRYLKYNDQHMPGDANKIISNGTSAGGAMSSLLGATADHPDYEPYLEALGAAPASDAVFAVSAYCPITDLEHADVAYEWQFQGIYDYSKLKITQLDYNVQRTKIEATLTEEQIQASEALKTQFAPYLESLQLKNLSGDLYSLDESGNGNFKDAIKAQLIASANQAIAEGKGLHSYAWLSFSEDGTQVVDIDFSAYVRSYLARNKAAPAFDGLSLEAGENTLFGDAQTDAKHFTAFSAEHSLATGAQTASGQLVKMMNPLQYLTDPQSKVAQHRRIRHGAKDADTSLAVPFILAESLKQKAQVAVDFAYPRDQGHGGDYDLDALLQWMNGITH